MAGVASADQVGPSLKLTSKGPDCTSKDQLNKLIEKGQFIIFTRGTIDKTTIESWINNDGAILTIGYDTPKDNKSENIKDVCVLSFAMSVNYNGEVIEKLYDAMNKKAPKT
jgi:hypothetical protein